MASAFGGQRSIQLSYGCKRGAVSRGCGDLPALCEGWGQWIFRPGAPIVLEDSAFENQRALASPVMDATPIRQDAGTLELSAAAALAGSGAPASAASPPASLAARWDALHDAAAILAQLAGTGAVSLSLPQQDGAPDFAGAMVAAGGWRQMLAEQGVDDLAAILEAGLVALLQVHARGADPAPAAQALWQEFLAARQALLVLLPPGSSGLKVSQA